MSPQLQQVLSEIDRLSPTEQIQVMTHVIESIKGHVSKEPIKSTRRWSDFIGMAKAPLVGEDAQEWVSRTRKEGDDHRENVLRTGG
jgi:hypothetical protein